LENVAQSIIRSINAGDADEEIRAVLKVVNERIKTVARIALATLEVGDRVRFNDNTRPVYLRGATAVVQKVNHQSVTVTMETGVRKYAAGSKIRVPNTLLDRAN